jgi:hypothetical protein
MSLHVFITWLISILLYPVFLLIYIGGEYSFDTEQLAFLFGLFVFTLVFGLPSLLLSLLVMRPIAKAPVTDSSKFIIWCIAAILTVVANFYLIFYFILKEDIFRSASIELILPALLAVSITILIRFKYFFTAVSKTGSAKDLIIETEGPL